MHLSQKISPCLWFDDQAYEAATFYTQIFDNARITGVTHYGAAGFEIHGRPAGSVMSVVFELCAETFTALNGGPLFTFNEAISLQINCVDQAEIDHYWAALGEGGDPAAQQCGWLKDRYGVSWQVVPTLLTEMIGKSDQQAVDRVMTAMLQMKKLDIATLKAAFDGD
jgi:predicted 3-demethylubiquinone-9 3-methyltransferase (glyoxalase superfamily)